MATRLFTATFFVTGLLCAVSLTPTLAVEWEPVAIQKEQRDDGTRREIPLSTYGQSWCTTYQEALTKATKLEEANGRGWEYIVRPCATLTPVPTKTPTLSGVRETIVARSLPTSTPPKHQFAIEYFWSSAGCDPGPTCSNKPTPTTTPTDGTRCGDMWGEKDGWDVMWEMHYVNGYCQADKCPLKWIREHRNVVQP